MSLSSLKCVIITVFHKLVLGKLFILLSPAICEKYCLSSQDSLNLAVFLDSGFYLKMCGLVYGQHTCIFLTDVLNFGAYQ